MLLYLIYFSCRSYDSNSTASIDLLSMNILVSSQFLNPCTVFPYVSGISCPIYPQCPNIQLFSPLLSHENLFSVLLSPKPWITMLPNPRFWNWSFCIVLTLQQYSASMSAFCLILWPSSTERTRQWWFCISSESLQHNSKCLYFSLWSFELFNIYIPSQWGWPKSSLSTHDHLFQLPSYGLCTPPSFQLPFC